MTKHSHVHFCLLLALMTVAIISTLTAPTVAKPNSCCTGTRGNVDGKGIIDLGDLQALVLYLTGSGYVPPCMDAANVDGKGIVDLGDLTMLVGYLTGVIPSLPACPTATITYATRLATFTALDSVQAGLTGVSPDSLANALIAFLGSRSEFEAYGKDGTTVWARFKDGRILVVPNNRFPTGLPDSTSVVGSKPGDSTIPEGFTLPNRRFASWDPTAPVALQRTPSAESVYELPSSTQVRVISTLPSCFTTLQDKATALLGGSSYVVASDGTVPGLLSISGDGLFYIDAHCGSARARSVDSAVVCVLTSSIVSAATDSLYASMLDSNELVYMDTQDFGDGLMRYAFTGRFVAQYMSFAKNSFVLINACYSNYQTVKAGFAAAGASVYAGWTKPVADSAANRAGEFLLDRLLGANKSTWSAKENPPQRPFDIDQLWQQMKDNGYDTDLSSDGSKLIVSRLQDNFGLLAPSIATVLVDQRARILCLYGTFGSQITDGQVTVGGVQLPIQDWGYNSSLGVDTIACTIPDEGPGSAGDVQVTVRKIKSNVTQLSRYKGQITQTHATNDGRQYDITVNFQMRVDLQPFRTEPGKPPQYDETTYVVHGDQPSTANYTCQGVTNFADGGTITWTGSGSLNNDIDTADSPKGFKVGAWFDPGNKKVQMYLFGTVEDGISETLVDHKGDSYFVTHTIDYGDDTFDGYHAGYPPYFEMPMDSTYSIVKGSKAASSVFTYYSVLPLKADSVTVKWDNITCEYPPDPSAARAPQAHQASLVK